MSDTTHIFTPTGDTLTERIRAYQKVFNDFRNVKFSVEHANDKEWSDTLGDTEEINQAYEITQTSLNIAISSIKQSELEQAKKEGLMNDSELIELIKLQRKQELKDIREGYQDSNSKDFNPNR